MTGSRWRISPRRPSSRRSAPWELQRGVRLLHLALQDRHQQLHRLHPQAEAPDLLDRQADRGPGQRLHLRAFRRHATRPTGSSSAASGPGCSTRAIDALPEKYRKVIQLRHVEEKSYEEIARQLRLPIGTVKAHIFRARELLYKSSAGPHPALLRMQLPTRSSPYIRQGGIPPTMHRTAPYRGPGGSTGVAHRSPGSPGDAGGGSAGTGSRPDHRTRTQCADLLLRGEPRSPAG